MRGNTKAENEILRGCLTVLGISRFNRSNRSLTVAARLRRLLIQRELPSRDRQGAVAG
jgi:hypothetical protein